MHQVGDRAALDGDVRRGDDLDPGVVLDLGDGRTDHLGGRHRPGELAGQAGTREHQQGLRVAPHPGGQVVQLEELGQALGVLFRTLDRVQLADHPVNQRLRPAREVEEHRRDTGTQGGLFRGDPDRLPVYRVERLGHLPDLVPAVDPHRVLERGGDLVGGGRADVAQVAQPGDRVGQLPADHGHRTLAEQGFPAGFSPGLPSIGQTGTPGPPWKT